MPIRKDKFSKKDKKFMSLALTLASARHGLTGENPSVGCVIVNNDQIISLVKLVIMGDHMLNTMQSRILLIF